MERSEKERETERVRGSRRAGHLVGWRNTFSEGVEESILSETKAEEEVTHCFFSASELASFLPSS